MYNIIADIAGRYNELMKLVEIMPKDRGIILVGDLVDRGLDSRKVVEWAMNTPDVLTLKGNHEAMMIEAYETGHSENDHTYNGGRMTMQSYGVFDPMDYPKHHINWMKNLPIFIMNDGLFVSHAPWHRSWKLGEYTSEFWALWHRGYPGYKEGFYQVYGHNHQAEVHINGDGIEYARCIDNCAKRVLTGFTYPEKIIYEVPYE
jgi:hypothetical protein